MTQQVIFHQQRKMKKHIASDISKNTDKKKKVTIQKRKKVKKMQDRDVYIIDRGGDQKMDMLANDELVEKDRKLKKKKTKKLNLKDECTRPGKDMGTEQVDNLTKKKKKLVKGKGIVDRQQGGKQVGEELRDPMNEKSIDIAKDSGIDSSDGKEMCKKKKKKGRHIDTDSKVIRKEGTFAPKDSKSGVLAIKEHKKKVVTNKLDDIFAGQTTDIGSGMGSAW